MYSNMKTDMGSNTTIYCEPGWENNQINIHFPEIWLQVIRFSQTMRI